MKRMIHAISIAAIASVVACATSKAAPVAPIPTAIVSSANHVEQVYYYHGHYYPYYYHGHYYHRRGWHHGHYGYW
jgi:hypothetical protein